MPNELVIDWAVGLLVTGVDTPSLRVLAGLSPPLDYFEATKLIDKTLAELEIPRLDAAGAVEAYAVELLTSFFVGRSELSEVLGELSQLCIATSHDHSLYPFYLLNDALDELHAFGSQWCWDGADLSNIAGIVREQARVYLGAHATAV